jgi:4-hydroxy-3-methylbut-2-enyl diphosphate reductase
MNVIVAEEHGFCVGVKLALKKLDAQIAANPNVKVYSVGEIIHNADVIRQYQEQGVETVDKIEDAKGGPAVVRAHGLPESWIKRAKAAGIEVDDATCPFVRVIDRAIAKELTGKSRIYLVGEPEHPEVFAAVHDYADSVTVIDHRTFDPEAFDYPKGCATLLSQTTMSVKRFAQIVSAFAERCTELHVYNTVCPSTRNRQSSALETARKSDVMIVLGGKKSSNTKRLAELCAEICPTYHVERIGDLDASILHGKATAGVTAGASTPEWIVDEAVEFLKRFEQGKGSFI